MDIYILKRETTREIYLYHSIIPIYIYIGPSFSQAGQRPKFRAQELFQSRGDRPGLSVPNSPYGLCGRKSALNLNDPTS